MHRDAWNTHNFHVPSTDVHSIVATPIISTLDPVRRSLALRIPKRVPRLRPPATGAATGRAAAAEGGLGGNRQGGIQWEFHGRGRWMVDLDGAVEAELCSCFAAEGLVVTKSGSSSTADTWPELNPLQ